MFRDTYFFNWVYFRVKQATLKDVRGYFSFVQEYYSGEPWERMSEKLDQIQTLCKANGTDFRIVVFPFLHNLGPEYPFREAHQKIVEYCRSRDIPVLDLEPELTPFAATVGDAFANARVDLQAESEKGNRDQAIKPPVIAAG